MHGVNPHLTCPKPTFGISCFSHFGLPSIVNPKGDRLFTSGFLVATEPRFLFGSFMSGSLETEPKNIDWGRSRTGTPTSSACIRSTLSLLSRCSAGALGRSGGAGASCPKPARPSRIGSLGIGSVTSQTKSASHTTRRNHRWNPWDL